jgi:FAD synthetase
LASNIPSWYEGIISVKIEQAEKLAKKLHTEKKSIVLAGGCFDLLHIGHLIFLQNAKVNGDILIVLVESDEAIKKIKGQGRPINTQLDRAKILEALQIVDFVIPLKPLMQNADYDTLITNIQPDIIATTKGDPNRAHKERQAKANGAQVIDVTTPVKDQSTTRLIALLQESYEY